MGFEEWTTFATIVLSVVAIIIAIWSSRSTSRAANKQIAEIKQLSKLQIDTTIKQLEAEIQKIMAEVKKAAQDCREVDEINKAAEHLGAEYKNIMMRKHQENKASRDLQIYSDCTHNLNEILNELNKLKRKLG